ENPGPSHDLRCNLRARNNEPTTPSRNRGGVKRAPKRNRNVERLATVQIALNFSPPHFGHGTATSARAGRVKHFVWPQTMHFHANDFCSARCSILLRTEAA